MNAYKNMQNFEKRRAAALSFMLETDPALDMYAYVAILRMECGTDVALAEQQIKRTADWFELAHPTGRDHRGECDFVGLSLLNALFRFYDKLSLDTRASLERFFLRRNFISKFGSENHALMGRVIKLLAAQFYKGRYFEQFQCTAQEAYDEAKAYLLEFLAYRATHGWGEFDSCGYNAEDMAILNTLYMYTDDCRLRQSAQMHMDILLLDMTVDSRYGLHGGAHGRIYPDAALDSCVGGSKVKFYHATMYSYYCYYFGSEGKYPQRVMTHCATLLSDYFPAQIVYRIAKDRTYPYENRERRHLHQSRGFRDVINRDLIASVEGLSIDKYTYVCDDYMLGAVNHQDDYPKDNVGAWYAHHEQHEWELTLLGRGDGRAKIFSHHPGNPGYYQIHNQWTGDSHCNCSTHFCTKNTAISMYDIKNETYVPPTGHTPPEEAYSPKHPGINADIPLALFDERILEKNYIFLRYDKLFVMLWFSNGYRFAKGESAEYEALSDGWKHCFICHVDYAANYTSLASFATAMKQHPITFDPDTMTAAFMEVRMDYKERYVQGKKQVFPYKLFDSPYMQSEYGTGIYRISDDRETVIYDFNKGEHYVDGRKA